MQTNDLYKNPKDIRIIYLLRREDEAYFFDIGTHDEVYRK